MGQGGPVLKAFLYFFAAVALFAAGYATRYYLEQASTLSGTAASPEASGQGDLRRAAKLVRVTEWHWDRAGLFPDLVATVVNSSNRALNVTLTFNLYDKSGAQVDSTSGSITGLQPGSKGRVSATVLGDYTVSHDVHANTLTARLVKINVF
jgi:hypothetical protein